MGRIEVSNLRKVFDAGGNDLVAVDDLDFTIEDGEFLVLVGPSGCGKSTTLRCISGLETPTSGEIVLDGENVTRAKPKDRNMAMVFQNYALYPHMTARENMSFGLKMTTDLSNEEIDERVENVAEMTGIERNLDQKPGELSGGQQQRVALGRAIVRDPEVFLMDEPLSNLDAKLRSEMRTELQNLQNDFGVTTIYVTHDQTEAMTMGDRIAILDDGELQQIGTPLECYHTPVNKFVAGFIGSPSMNFLDVTLNDETLVHEEFTYGLSVETAKSLETDETEYVLGIRPEDIEVVSADTPNAIEATVNVVEPLGDVAHVNINLGNQSYTASINGTPRWESGRKIQVKFPEESLHLFVADSGEAVKNATIETGEHTVDAPV
ncbi:ABC transporter related protein (plasmid) [Haloterrigena turkmenica DSM 5511]|uniref:ABC-type D-xylose/L-arabinose transporter n=1 Tax=Haloterrigena turkmenica (strain ATCC 51198 / DSM 5511 / JCM 9101 / NCIMB 13204 / VKM B-1734 / 4k) TaxID=543526 RepID=D2S236_HALTV|nr:ABC transporter ATP-binding protein [Haloterrigena turkmenica]ADB63433.1 ABC transporter related protein [Haloterrigena turkmenica DSM 5511]